MNDVLESIEDALAEARFHGIEHGCRELSLVITKLEEALLWADHLAEVGVE